MPRSLVFGNGKLFVAIDSVGRIRELTYPLTGRWNHLNGRTIAYGIYIDGHMSWLDSADWQHEFVSEPHARVGHIISRSERHQIKVEREIGVHPESALFSIRWTFTNFDAKVRKFEVFATEHLQIMESDTGDTALFDFETQSVIHFKGPVAIGFGGEGEFGQVHQFACGVTGYGSEGTWRDCDDGVLSNNPIAQGAVDASWSLSCEFPAHGTTHLNTWIVASPSVFQAQRDLVSARNQNGATLEHLRQHDTEFAKALADRLGELPQDIRDFTVQSALLLKVFCAANGAVIAAIDSDIMQTNRAHYAYCWPRDGAKICNTLLACGDAISALNFLQFCLNALEGAPPYFLQKYTPDAELGATWHPWIEGQIPFQEDETASVVQLAVKIIGDGLASDHLKGELIEKLICRCTDFLIEYVDSETGLPLPSYDLWEERRGIHAYTVAQVILAIEAARELLPDQFPTAADTVIRMRKALTEHFVWTDESGRKNFGRMIEIGTQGYILDKTPDAASLLALDTCDPIASDRDQIVQHLTDAIQVHSSVGGYARYPGDYYARVSEQYPGNPWVITTLWAERATTSDRDQGLQSLRWVMARATDSGLLAEQFHPETGVPLTVSPLPWSHAEFVDFALKLCAEAPIPATS